MSINGVLLAFAVFIIVSMSIYWGFFEEWTIWTDYTMAWVEFNFFIYYWDRLTITRVYLSLIYIYGFVLLASKFFLKIKKKIFISLSLVLSRVNTNSCIPSSKYFSHATCSHFIVYSRSHFNSRRFSLVCRDHDQYERWLSH